MQKPQKFKGLAHREGRIRSLQIAAMMRQSIRHKSLTLYPIELGGRLWMSQIRLTKPGAGGIVVAVGMGGGGTARPWERGCHRGFRQPHLSIPLRPNRLPSCKALPPSPVPCPWPYLFWACGHFSGSMSSIVAVQALGRAVTDAGYDVLLGALFVVGFGYVCASAFVAFHGVLAHKKDSMKRYKRIDVCASDDNQRRSVTTTEN